MQRDIPNTGGFKSENFIAHRVPIEMNNRLLLCNIVFLPSNAFNSQPLFLDVGTIYINYILIFMARFFKNDFMSWHQFTIIKLHIN